MTQKTWKVYLSGEIHTDWREQIEGAVSSMNLPISFSSPVTDHQTSDACGASILGEEENRFWYDRKSSQLNAIRTRNLIQDADIVVIRFGEKYRQWNAAFDAGYAAALGKSIITLHPDELIHALKEVDAAALAVTKDVEQVVEVLHYTATGSTASSIK